MIEHTCIERQDFEINGSSPVSDEQLLDTPVKDIRSTSCDLGYMGNESAEDCFASFFWAGEFVDDNSQVEQAAKSLCFKITGSTDDGDFIEDIWLTKLLKSGITLRELITLVIDEVNALGGSPKSESLSSESSGDTKNSNMYKTMAVYQRQQQQKELNELNEQVEDLSDHMDGFY